MGCDVFCVCAAWERGSRNPPVQNNKSLPGYNLDTFVDSFVQTTQRQAAVTQGSNVMWTLGDDFNYQDAGSWFPNLDKLIDGVNADGRVKTLYSTPSIYLKAKHDEDLKWPLKTDDFVSTRHTHHQQRQRPRSLPQLTCHVPLPPC